MRSFALDSRCCGQSIFDPLENLLIDVKWMLIKEWRIPIRDWTGGRGPGGEGERGIGWREVGRKEEVEEEEVEEERNML